MVASWVDGSLVGSLSIGASGVDSSFVWVNYQWLHQG